MTGRIHRLESLSALDGPGLRYVVFMQGCPLKCVFCHNADSLAFDGGFEMECDDLISGIRRVLPYLSGGVTFSGGEPLLQAGFCAEALSRLREMQVHTALQTSGIGTKQGLRRVFAVCDLVMLDIKAATEDGYANSTQGTAKLSDALCAIGTALELGCAVQIRHVVLPGINDTKQAMNTLVKTLAPFGVRPTLVPYHTMGLHKWPAESPVAHLPAADAALVAGLQAYVDAASM